MTHQTILLSFDKIYSLFLRKFIAIYYYNFIYGRKLIQCYFIYAVIFHISYNSYIVYCIDHKIIYSLGKKNFIYFYFIPGLKIYNVSCFAILKELLIFITYIQYYYMFILYLISIITHIFILVSNLWINF